MSLTVATYNMGRTGTADDLTKLAAAGVTVVCLQEMSDRQGIRLPDGWQAYWPDFEPGQAATPIIYDTRSLGDRPIAVGSRLMTPATSDLEDGAGGSSVKPKWANWVRFNTPAAEEPVTVVNVHAIPTVQGRDGPIRSKPKRLAWHARHMAALADLVRELRGDGGLVIVAGDFNVAYSRESVDVAGWPVRALGAAGLTCTYEDLGMPERDTKDNRSIDYVFASRPSAAHRVPAGYSSDHRPLLADYELVEPPPPVHRPEGSDTVRYPAADWRPVTRYLPGGSSEATSLGMRRLILHTAVTNADSLFNSMNTPGTATSHFYIDRDGRVEQYVATDIRSSANLEGNHDCITVETWDGAYVTWDPRPPTPDPVPPWTPAQVEALARLAVWAHKTHGIPLERLSSSLPGTRGIGWHRLGIDGDYPAGLLAGRVPGGEVWSESDGKSCPGDNRIRQIVEQIIPRAKTIIEGDTDMQLTDTYTEGKTVGALFRHLDRYMGNDAKRDEALKGQVAALSRAVDALPEGATKAEIKGLLENIDATVVLKVNDPEPAA